MKKLHFLFLSSPPKFWVDSHCRNFPSKFMDNRGLLPGSIGNHSCCAALSGGRVHQRTAFFGTPPPPKLSSIIFWSLSQVQKASGILGHKLIPRKPRHCSFIEGEEDHQNYWKTIVYFPKGMSKSGMLKLFPTIITNGRGIFRRNMAKHKINCCSPKERRPNDFLRGISLS